MDIRNLLSTRVSTYLSQRPNNNAHYTTTHKGNATKRDKNVPHTPSPKPPKTLPPTPPKTPHPAQPNSTLQATTTIPAAAHLPSTLAAPCSSHSPQQQAQSRRTWHSTAPLTPTLWLLSKETALVCLRAMVFGSEVSRRSGKDGGSVKSVTGVRVLGHRLWGW